MVKRYYILNIGPGSSGEVFPSNNPVATERQLEGTRVWREEVGEIKISKTNNATVYDALDALFVDKNNFDKEIEVEIYTGTQATGVLYWKGLYSISDTTNDVERTTITMNPIRVNDDYRTILEQSEIQLELDADSRGILETKRIGFSESIILTSTWANPAAGYSNIATLNTPTPGSILTAIATDANVLDAASTNLPALANNDIVILDVAGWTKNSGGDPMFDIEYGGGIASMTDEGFKNIATGTMAYTISTGQASPRLVMRTQPVPSAVFDVESITFTMRKIAAANDKTSAGELLMTFLNTFISSTTYMGVTAFNGNVVSTFFDNDALPTGAPSTISTFIGANPNGNYVTETTDNELNSTIIGLLREWFDVSVVSFKLSFNDIMGQLREMFDVYWFIDADGKFRVEHEKYFVKQVDDSTPIVISAIDEVDHRELKYNKSRIASTEQFSWAQSSNQDFVGNDIIYNNFETTNNALEHAVNFITTDIKYVIDNIADASNSGLGMYQCNLLTGITGADIYELNILTGTLSGSPISNAAFSWANLHNNYWSWSRMAESATRNGTAATMDSAVRFLEQGGVRFYYSTSIDPFTLVTTTLTSGAPIEIRRDLETDFVEILVGYDPYKL